IRLACAVVAIARRSEASLDRHTEGLHQRAFGLRSAGRTEHRCILLRDGKDVRRLGLRARREVVAELITTPRLRVVEEAINFVRVDGFHTHLQTCDGLEELLRALKRRRDLRVIYIRCVWELRIAALNDLARTNIA